MAYDAATGKIVLFGGYNDNPNHIAFTDTWTWNGETWKKLPHTGPKVGFATQMTFDASTQQLILFGGSDLNRVFHRHVDSQREHLERSASEFENRPLVAVPQ